MLTKIRIKNFRSFKNETIIDFSATKSAMLKDTNIENGVLKGCLFVGGNASGKTNAIGAISALMQLLFNPLDTDVTPFVCWFSADKELELEYTFKFEKDTIVYLLVLDKKGIIKREHLVLNNEVLIDRIGLSARTSINGNEIYYSNEVEERSLLLKSIYYQNNYIDAPIIKKWFEYLQNSVCFNAGQAKAFDYNNKVRFNDYLAVYGADKINDFLNRFNFRCELLFVRKDEYQFRQIELKELNVLHKDTRCRVPIEHESGGLKTLLSILPSILQVTERGGMLIVDQFGGAFHNELEELIIRYFMSEAKNAQLFFTSHSTNIMKLSLLRPDQIYALDYGKSGSTVKRLSSKLPRDTQNMEKMYLGGAFGGLPNYTEDSK